MMFTRSPGAPIMGLGVSPSLYVTGISTATWSPNWSTTMRSLFGGIRPFDQKGKPLAIVHRAHAELADRGRRVLRFSYVLRLGSHLNGGRLLPKVSAEIGDGT